MPQRTEHVVADTKLTPLLVSKGNPLMWTTSLPTLLVIFPVFLLKPVNCTVAPRVESITEPTRPATKPAKNTCWLLLEVPSGHEVEEAHYVEPTGMDSPHIC